MPGPNDVDKVLFAQTSGAAAHFAQAHSADYPLKLYGGWFCPFVQRAWIVMHEKSIPHQYVEINPYHKAPEFLALNPRGLVPTLAVPMDPEGKEQKPLYESLVVCEYLDEVYQDPSKHGTPLLPEGIENAYDRARCRLWIDHISSRIIPCFYRFIQHTPDKSYSIEEVREEFLEHLKTLMKQMTPESEGPWFLGRRFSMVDVMLAPWAMRLFLIEHYKPGGLGIPGFDVKNRRGTSSLVEQNGNAEENGNVNGKSENEITVWRRWSVWYDAIRDRQSVKDTWSDDSQYIEAYKRYAEDTTGSQVGHATRGGRGLP